MFKIKFNWKISPLPHYEWGGGEGIRKRERKKTRIEEDKGKIRGKPKLKC
jgi:hypothetical protein